MLEKVDSAHLDEVGVLLLEGGTSRDAVQVLRRRLKAGELRAVFGRSADGVAVTVVDARGAWRQVLAAHGPQSALLAGLVELRATSEALIWDEQAVRIEGTRLDELGFRRMERQVFTQELSRVPAPDPDPADFQVAPLGDADVSEARSLFGRTHAASVEGLYATLPHEPTLTQCEAAFDGYLSGSLGAVVPAACVAVRRKGSVVGVICCAAGEDEGTGVLLGLAVDPSQRGRGLSRVLVRRAQQALLASGFQRMLFLTTDRNTPVHRLFTLDEIISTETFPTRLWLRNPPPPLKRES